MNKCHHLPNISFTMTNCSDISDENNQVEWLDTNSAVGLFIAIIIICLINEFVLYSLINMAHHKVLIVGKLMKCYAYFNIVCGPIIAIIVFGVIALVPISTTFGSWFCESMWFVSNYSFFFIANFSSMTTCMLYVNFVYEQKVNNYGKELVNNIF